ncbi:glycerophosphoryl diester phosphodiesterase membrane domain-containing protein [Capillimicrobium parvum]|uniref:DUF7847 domain-containing protein n=1 Tax=Capillimicrobium parvum TaxID=2884022 RepID=A0A9E6Y0C6_9ACTN|nr:glycerophosphoryl diester phosphodiesterase membrane domain-containing protein [Capillimicrobium parvum]UGS37101.1 hypothetical protein DSM104329_03515 [Capillimicrobium parvum]
MTLRSRRDLGAILRDALTLYGGQFRTFFLIALVVVVPVDLIVLGVGLGQLSGPFDSSPSAGAQAVELGVTYLVTTPLITAMAIEALRRERGSTGQAIQAGLDAFPHVLLVMVLYAAAIAVGVLLLIVPGIIAGIRLLFGIQMVVLEGRRGVPALRRSWELTDGCFWRVLGINLVIGLAAGIAGVVVGIPLTAAAQSADADWLALAASMLSQTVVAPFVAIATTLLYFDLLERSETTA